MTDISLIAVLKRHGWKTHKTSTLKTWTKERLVEEIQALENNYACALEMSDNQYNLLLKMHEEKEQLKEKIKKLRKKLFDILTDYEIGNYDNSIHQFYEDVYDIHNELMDKEFPQSKKLQNGVL